MLVGSLTESGRYLSPPYSKYKATASNTYCRDDNQLLGGASHLTGRLGGKINPLN